MVHPFRTSLGWVAVCLAALVGPLGGCSSSGSGGAPDGGASEASVDGDGGDDGGPDARPDATDEAGLDAALDAMPDATPDASDDASLDGGDDAALDAMPDATPDATPDASDDASLDGGDDAALDASEDASLDGGPDASACDGGCPAELCVAGQCVQCTATEACPDVNQACELGSNTCVDCLPSDDTCAAGTYCTDAFACAQGCKDGSECASGVCDGQHECERCLGDLECGEAQVCGTFVCGPTCGNPGDPSCTGGTECCGDQCVDTAEDIEHCGGCNMACTADQFCGRGTVSSTCIDVELARFCENLRAAVVKTGLAGDDAQADLLAVAIESGCSPAPTVRVVDQYATDVLNPTTGQPVAGGNDLLITLGGNYQNLLVQYAERQGLAPLYLSLYQQGGDWHVRRTADEFLVYSGTIASETTTEGHFVLQLMRDPASGTLILNAWGITAEATAAARVFIANQVLANPSQFTGNTWYFFAWSSDPIYTFTELAKQSDG